jgi:enolase
LKVTVPAIDSIDAMTVLDSRGFPTIRVTVSLSDGSVGKATAPSGASTGSHESVELRDRDPAFGGRGVRRAIGNVVNTIAPALRGKPVMSLQDIDEMMVSLDGTPDRSNLGANALVAVSMAVARAAAQSANAPLWYYLRSGGPGKPVPMFNVLNGGVHAKGGLRVQECMIVPGGFGSLFERIRCGAEVYASLRNCFDERNMLTAVGDEGGFVFRQGRIETALDLLVTAIKQAGYEPGAEVTIAIDAAANNLRNEDGSYTFDQDVALDVNGAIAWWGRLIDDFPITLLEDPLGEDDWDGWQALTKELGGRVGIIGDDIFVTNPEIIAKAVSENVANAALLKPNQIGTVSETIRAAQVARAGNYRLVVSHRSGETCDTFISDLAVALGAEFIKTGAPARGERTEKYNRLLEIEAELGRWGLSD